MKITTKTINIIHKPTSFGPMHTANRIPLHPHSSKHLPNSVALNPEKETSITGTHHGSHVDAQ